MDVTYSPLTHPWTSHHLAAQILRAWVVQTLDSLPAWTPAAVSEAYASLFASCEAVVRATRQAEREAPPHA